MIKIKIHKCHLSGLIRGFRHWLMTALFVRSCHRNGIKVEIGSNCVLDHCFIKGDSENVLLIEDNCTLSYCSFCFYGKGGSIILRNDTKVNASSGARTCMYVRGSICIEIGKCCLIAHSVDISTTDFHSVLDCDGNVVNVDESVKIGNHVWIGKRVTINKGTILPDDSIVGASSVVTKVFTTPNVLIAGSPAVVRRHGISWCK